MPLRSSVANVIPRSILLLGSFDGNLNTDWGATSLGSGERMYSCFRRSALFSGTKYLRILGSISLMAGRRMLWTTISCHGWSQSEVTGHVYPMTTHPYRKS